MVLRKATFCAGTGFPLCAYLFFFLCAGYVDTAQAKEITVHDTPRIITLGIDARDYGVITKELANSILTDQRIPSGGSKVLVLGPVTTDSCIYRFDPLKFQEKLQTVIHRSGRMQVTFAVDAFSGNSAAEERYKIMRLQWEKESIVDPGDLKTWGLLADVDYLLFGRLTSQTATKGKQTEVTHTFNWKLGECRTGLLEWTDEAEITKRGDTPEIPEWITDARGDSESYYYVWGEGLGQTARGSKTNALNDARDRLAQRINKRLPESGRDLIISFSGDNLEVEMISQGESSVRRRKHWQSWVLIRCYKDRYLPEIEKRTEALNLWLEAESLYQTRSGITGSKKKIHLLRDIDRKYRDLLARYPIGSERIFSTERVAFRLAELERYKGNPCAAENHYRSVLDGSVSYQWKNKARIKLKEVGCGEDEYKIFLWRRDFEGRNVAITCAYRVDNRFFPWDKAKGELSAFLQGMGPSLAGQSRNIPPETASQWVAEPEKGRRYLSGQGLDYLIILFADGDFNLRENDNNPFGTNKSFQFSGSVKSLVLTKQGVHFSNNYSCVGGWNPISKQMGMDVLALAATKRWKKKFFELMGGRN